MHNTESKFFTISIKVSSKEKESFDILLNEAKKEKLEKTSSYSKIGRCLIQKGCQDRRIQQILKESKRERAKDLVYHLDTFSGIYDEDSYLGNEFLNLLKGGENGN
jgi:hypothetical protein